MVSLDEDRLAQNGIVIDDNSKGGNASQAEQVQLTNLLTESTETLRLGFEEKFSMSLHLDGSSLPMQSPVWITSFTTPPLARRGGIDRSVSGNIYRRNNVSTGDAVTTQATAITFLAAMETQWRACIKNGGRLI